MIELFYKKDDIGITLKEILDNANVSYTLREITYGNSYLAVNGKPATNSNKEMAKLIVRKIAGVKDEA